MDKQIRNILFTSDMTQGSRYVFEYVLSLALGLGAGIIILHVLEGTSAAMTTMQKLLGNFLTNQEMEEMRRKHKNEAMMTLTGKSRHFSAIRDGFDMVTREAASRMAAGDIRATEIVVSEGNKVDEILRVAEEKNCQLIVVGTHHHGHISETLIGSTSHGLLRKSEIPVLAVPVPQNLG